MLTRAEIIKLHHQSILVDGHADSFGKTLSRDGDFLSPGPKALRWGEKAKSDNDWQHMDFLRMVKGGVDLQFMAIYTPPFYQGADATLYALKMLTAMRKAVSDSNGKIVFIRSSKDLKELAKGKKGLLVDIESGICLDKSLRLLEMFHHLGVRSISLTQNHANELADGVRVDNPRGLTALGKKVIREINRLNMILDIVHLARPGFKDAMKIAKGPVICSHTGVRKFRDILRNIDDDQIKEIARRKGVVGMYVSP
ncbi:MAG: membrane dipeptidase [Planctomycetes bacterium]|nr:membrane dipeptidase [Planctomycetota bacterium]